MASGTNIEFLIGGWSL